MLFFNLEDNNIIEIDLNKIEDSKDNRTPLEDLSNIPYLGPFRETLIKAFLNNNSSINKSFNKNRKLLRNINLYLDKVNSFLKLLLLNIYLLGGSPLREEELVVITYKNTILRGLKDIYLDKETKLISINTTYSKSKDITKLNKYNIRFLPFRLSRVLVYYITIVCPFIYYLNFTYFKEDSIEPNLFLDKKKNIFTSYTLSSLLNKEFKAFNIEGITIKPYRHIITYIIKQRILKDKENLLTPTRENKTKYLNTIDDSLANRSTTISNLNYPRDINLFSNKTRDLTTRSIEFSSLYFNFFNLNTKITIKEAISSYNISKEDLYSSSNSSKSSYSSKTSTSTSSNTNNIDLDLKSKVSSSKYPNSTTSSKRLKDKDFNYFNNSSSSSSSSSFSSSKSSRDSNNRQESSIRV